MAERIVVLGAAGRCIEVHADDASALVSLEICRVSLTKWGGELANATVLRFTENFLDALEREHAHLYARSERLHDKAWERLGRVPLHDTTEFTVDEPIPVGQP